MYISQNFLGSVLIRFPKFHGDRSNGVVGYVLYPENAKGVPSSSEVGPPRKSVKGLVQIRYLRHSNLNKVKKCITLNEISVWLLMNLSFVVWNLKCFLNTIRCPHLGVGNNFS